MSDYGDLYVYVAKYGTFNSDGHDGSLAFTEKEKAKDWARNHNHVMDSAEWESDGRIERIEDKIDNWAQVKTVRISDPEGLFDYE